MVEVDQQGHWTFETRPSRKSIRLMTIGDSFLVSLYRRVGCGMPRAHAASPAGSVYSVSSSSDAEEYKPDSPAKKRKRPSGVVKRSAKGSAVKPAKAGPGEVNDLEDLPDDGPSILRPHAASYHSVAAVAAAQEDVLAWFDGVR